MNTDIIARLQGILANIDQLGDRLTLLHEDQMSEVRDQSGQAVVSAYAACQHCTSAKLSLAGVKSLLFNAEAVPFPGPQGQTNTEQNQEWFAMRCHDTAAPLGITCDEVAIAILDAAQDHYFTAHEAWIEAQVCAAM